MALGIQYKESSCMTLHEHDLVGLIMGGVLARVIVSIYYK